MKTQCGTASHKLKKLSKSLSKNVVVVTSKVDVAYARPMFLWDKISDELYDEWSNKECDDIRIWRKHFERAEGAFEMTSQPATLAALEAMEDALTKSFSVKTPKKIQISANEDESGGEALDSETLEWPSPGTPYEPTILPEDAGESPKDDLHALLRKIETELLSLGTGQAGWGNQVKEFAKGIQRDVFLLKNAVHSLATQLGPLDEGPDNLEGADIFGMVTALADRTENATEEFKSLEELVRAAKSQMAKTEEKVRSQLSSKSPKVDDELSELKLELATLVADMDGVFKFASRFEEEVAAVKAELRRVSPSSHPAIEVAWEDVAERLTVLVEERMGQAVAERQAEEAFDLGGAIIRDNSDMEKWVDSHLCGGLHDPFVIPTSLACFADVFVMMHLGSGSNTSFTEFVNRLKSGKNITAPNSALGTFFTLGQEIPSFFGETLNRSGRYPVLFDKIPTWTKWSNSNGSHHDFAEAVKRGDEACRQIVRSDRSLDDDGKAIALEFIRLTKDLLVSIGDLINKETRDLIENCGYSAPQAWSIISTLVARIFKDISIVRSPYSNTVDPGISPKSSVAEYMFAVVKAQKVQNSFLARELKDHASIASQYIKGLATHSGHADVDDLKARVVKLEETVTKLSGELKAMKTEHNQLKSEFKTALGKLKAASIQGFK